MSEIIWEKGFVQKVICNSCKHRISGKKCKAFDVIPDDIIFGRLKHEKALPGQKGDYVYEKIK